MLIALVFCDTRAHDNWSISEFSYTDNIPARVSAKKNGTHVVPVAQRVTPYTGGIRATRPCFVNGDCSASS